MQRFAIDFIVCKRSACGYIHFAITHTKRNCEFPFEYPFFNIIYNDCGVSPKMHCREIWFACSVGSTNMAVNGETSIPVTAIIHWPERHHRLKLKFVSLAKCHHRSLCRSFNLYNRLWYYDCLEVIPIELLENRTTFQYAPYKSYKFACAKFRINME